MSVRYISTVILCWWSYWSWHADISGIHGPTASILFWFSENNMEEHYNIYVHPAQHVDLRNLFGENWEHIIWFQCLEADESHIPDIRKLAPDEPIFSDEHSVLSKQSIPTSSSSRSSISSIQQPRIPTGSGDLNSRSISVSSGSGDLNPRSISISSGSGDLNPMNTSQSDSSIKQRLSDSASSSSFTRSRTRSLGGSQDSTGESFKMNDGQATSEKSVRSRTPRRFLDSGAHGRYQPSSSSTDPRPILPIPMSTTNSSGSASSSTELRP